MRDFHAYPFAFHGYYDWRVLAVARAVCTRGDVLIEVGANIGTETIGFRDVIGESGKLYAFEPLPSNIESLQKLVRINQWKNVKILPFAVGEKESTSQFAIPPSDWASGIGHVVFGETKKDQSSTITIRQIALDDIAEKFHRPIQVIFMDIEGYEVYALRGARKIIQQDRPIIVLEASPKLLHRAGTSLNELKQSLLGYQYSIWRITRFGLDEVSDAKAGKAANWLCVPNEKASSIIPKVRRTIFRSAILPCFKGINPLCGKDA